MYDKLHITTEHTGKMEHMWSLSTSCKGNPHCKAFSKIDGSICSRCYAQRMIKMYKNLDECLQRNADILTSVIIPEDMLPTINCVFFRFESFGDLINETQAINYFNICNANEDTHFALWTKNPAIIDNVITQMGYTKPNNLNIIVSSLFINKVYDGVNYDFIDKIFTVYDKDEAKKVDINCGKKKCIECKLCYKKNDVKYINEIVK